MNVCALFGSYRAGLERGSARDRKERLFRTEESLVDFITNGERVQYIVQTLRDLETFAIQEREAIADA